jgi:hypothetical protein
VVERAAVDPAVETVKGGLRKMIELFTTTPDAVNKLDELKRVHEKQVRRLSETIDHQQNTIDTANKTIQHLLAEIKRRDLETEKTTKTSR